MTAPDSSQEDSLSPTTDGHQDSLPLVVMVHPLGGMRGPARTLLALARYLAERWSVAVAAPDGFVTRELRESHPAVRVIDLPTRTSRRESWVRGAIALLKAMREEKRQTLIHANGLSALNLAAPAAIRLGAPVLVHFHDFRILPLSRVHLSVWRQLGIRMRFFPVSDFSRGLLEATTARELVGGVLPNPIDCSAFRASRNGPGRPFRIGFVGSKAPRKGLHRLVQIAHLLRDEDVEWHIYGVNRTTARTPYLGQCRRAIRDLGLEHKFHWLGETVDVASAYSNVDALLIPSDHESFSRVAVEGMASGLPLVATRIQGLSEVVRDGISGLLFDPRHSEDGAEKVRRILHEPELREHLTEGALLSASRFDTRSVGQMLEGLYGDLLSSQTGLSAKG